MRTCMQVGQDPYMAVIHPAASPVRRSRFAPHFKGDRAVKTYRLPLDLVDALAAEAAARDVAVNDLVVELLSERYAPRT